MAAQLRNREATVLHDALPHQLNTIIIDEGRSTTALFIMDILTTFGKLPTPATHHLLTHDVRPIDLTELPMNFNWRNALCIKELYHRPNLAGGGEGIRASISDHCCHATGTRRDLSGWHMIDTYPLVLHSVDMPSPFQSSEFDDTNQNVFRNASPRHDVTAEDFQNDTSRYKQIIRRPKTERQMIRTFIGKQTETT
ncbi:hypothetical protein ANN_04080 [Periplaneta americana]|uniref:Uncharacterized protein n=1 Tax=Periplaneta americana TaxID=6978 RepID=A0ABQ8T7L1_PERAM|nr:hypothetical protein ANN_04080 [Periplaneta americana]